MILIVYVFMNKSGFIYVVCVIVILSLLDLVIFFVIVKYFGGVEISGYGIWVIGCVFCDIWIDVINIVGVGVFVGIYNERGKIIYCI